MEKNIKYLLVALAIILIVSLSWGFIGATEASSPGVSCTFGIGDSLCWKWEKNALGRFQENVEDLFVK